MENGGVGSGVDHELGLVAVEFAIHKDVVSLDRELEALITTNLKKFADGEGLTLTEEQLLFLVPFLDVLLISLTQLVIGERCRFAARELEGQGVIGLVDQQGFNDFTVGTGKFTVFRLVAFARDQLTESGRSEAGQGSEKGKQGEWSGSHCGGK